MKREVSEKVRSFRPPLGLSCALAVYFAALSMAFVTTEQGDGLPPFARYAVFVCAAAFLALAVWAAAASCGGTAPLKRLKELARRMDFTCKMVDSFSYRTVAFTYLSLGMNVLFAAAKGVTGWFSASWWLITLSVYYIILCLARFLLLKESRRLDKNAGSIERAAAEWKTYRVCGALLLSMTLVLFGIVILIMRIDSKFTYYGILIFAVAAWDFFNLAVAIVYMARHKGKHTPIISAIKMLKLATALVSMLSLQTAMFASFGSTADIGMQRWMNLATGSAVCLMIFGMGLYMVLHANKRLKENALKEALK